MKKKTYIIMGVFIVLGLLGGFLIKPREDRPKKEKEPKSAPEPVDDTPDPTQGEGGGTPTYDF